MRDVVLASVPCRLRWRKSGSVNGGLVGPTGRVVSCARFHNRHAVLESCEFGRRQILETLSDNRTGISASSAKDKIFYGLCASRGLE